MGEQFAVINQPAGLGDILYTLKIADKIIREGATVYWPLIPEYMWLKRHINIPKLLFVPTNKLQFPLLDLYNSKCVDPVRGNNFLYLPLKYVLHNPKYAVEELPMYSKYIMAGMETSAFSWWDVYKDSLVLFASKALKIFELRVQSVSYIFHNKLVGSPDGTHLAELEPAFRNNYQLDLPIVYNQIIDGYSMFDWFRVLDSATEIHTPDTALCFIVDILRKNFGFCANTSLFMYPRDLRRANVPLYLNSCFQFSSDNPKEWFYVHPS